MSVADLQAEFVFGYSLPLHSAVKTLGSGKYELSLQFSPAVAGIVIRDMDVKVGLWHAGNVNTCIYIFTSCHV